MNINELFTLYSTVRQPQIALDPKLDASALPHYGYVVEVLKVLEYARQHCVFRDGETIDWENPSEMDETRCMYLVVNHFSKKEKFPFNYVSVMGYNDPANMISLYNNRQDLRLSRKRTMRLLTAIVRTFGVKDAVPMWWWDAYFCDFRYQSNVALYNPVLPPVVPITPYARDRRIAEAEAAEVAK
ncbi:hypothetical protein PENSPDRAFT_692820 [Peniophora sp. CONT]|nr:hypothetical protein PENSPDRAFT_692820 [Peniophora sp. CONT]